MSLAALALALASAVVHAAWNLLVKRAGISANTPSFAWLLFALSGLLFAPVAGWYLVTGRSELTGEMVPWIAGSAALHTVAFLMLLRAYRSGDLSLVYPIARGTGPLVVTIVGVALLGEPATVPSIGGVILIAMGIVVLRVPHWPLPAVARAQAAASSGADRPVVAAVPQGAARAILLGVLIAAYTLWDKHLVGRLALAPFVLECVLSLAMAAMVTPLVVRQAATIRSTMRDHAGTVVIVAILSSLSYVAFLTALSMAPASRVAPARELSILIGAVLGARVLGEPDSPRRVPAALMMTVGVILLAAF